MIPHIILLFVWIICLASSLVLVRLTIFHKDFGDARPPLTVSVPVWFITIFLSFVLFWFSMSPTIYQMDQPIECVVATTDNVDVAVIDGIVVNLNEQYGRDFEEGEKLVLYRPVRSYCWGIVYDDRGEILRKPVLTEQLNQVN